MNRNEGLKFHLQAVAVIVSICILVLSLGGCKKDADNLSSSVSSSSALSDLTSSTETNTSEPDGTNITSDTSSDANSSETIVDNRPKVNVADYGALVDDGIDDTEAIRSAVYAASEIGGGCIVQLEEGVYNINRISKDTPKGRPDTLFFDGVYNVSIVGYGATLLLGNPYSSGFGFLNSGNVTIKGVTIDYAVTPWVQGEVVSISQKDYAFTLKVDTKGKTVLDDPRWNQNTATYGLIRDSEDPRIARVGQGFFYGVSGNCKKVSDGVYQFNIDSDTYKHLVGSEIHKGTKIVINNRINSCGAFYFAAIEGDFNIEDCTIYASVGTSYCFGRINGNVRINNCKTTIKTGRWMTTNADGIYAPNINGSVTLTNSLIEGTGDDTINLHGKGSPIKKIISDKQIVINCWHTPTVGDTIYILDHKNGIIRGEATITKSQEIGKDEEGYRDFAVAFDRAIPGMLGTDKLETSDLVVFRKALSPGTVISNNIFRYNRGGGIKVNAMDVEITNNIIEYTVFSGITLYDIPSLKENAGTFNGLISGNKLKHTSYLRQSDDEKYAQIQIGARTSVMGSWDYGEAKGYMHRDLIIKDNTIKGVFKNGIYLSSAENVVLENNTVTGTADDSKTKNLGGIVLRNVKNVQVKNNIINNPNPRMGAGIKILENCVNVSVSGGKFTLAAGVEKIIDESNR